ncbi:MAG TPA: TlpA disulfide reductase family protein [Chitinophagaceae bacterium]|nr:TlpA disulfide reductase family protein [Chitinophagaceae bacterium]
MKHFFLILTLAFLGNIALAQVRVGDTAPEISLPDKNGTVTKLSSLKGKVVLIDFWSSWCVPCRRNNPFLVYLYKKYKSKGLEIYGLSIDEQKSKWLKAIAKDKLTWPQVIDNKGWDAPSAATYGVDAIPANFLLDKTGKIIAINLERQELEGKLKDLLEP